MPQTVALIVTDLQTSRMGLASHVSAELDGPSVLERTIARIASVPEVRAVVLVHPRGQNPLDLLGGGKFGKPILTHADAAGLLDAHTPMRRAARKWALAAWRGGLGGATCYDELLPAGPLADAMARHDASAALVLGADWPLVDPRYAQAVLRVHLEAPEAMPMAFTQAPPGLAPIAVGRDLMEQLAKHRGTFGSILAYHPKHPQADPIGKDVCHQIEPQVRSCGRRFIYDTPRARAMIDHVAARLGDRFDRADAAAIAAAVAELERDGVPAEQNGRGFQPQQVTLELTPRRSFTGPLTPQAHVTIDRPDIDTAAAIRIVRQFGNAGDVALTLGGLGDAMLHPGLPAIVRAAHEAGVLGICVETDLRVTPEQAVALLDLPIDVVSVRLNADSPATYRALTSDADERAFQQVIAAIEAMVNARNRRASAAAGGREPIRGDGEPNEAAGSRVGPFPGLPWIVPRMLKTRQTLAEMESFFDRWTHLLGHAVIEPATTGCGLAPELSPVRMAPPRRRPCRQVATRLTILSNNQVARCDQDWLGRACAGDATSGSLDLALAELSRVRHSHSQKQWDQLGICSQCTEWHRP